MGRSRLLLEVGAECECVGWVVMLVWVVGAGVRLVHHVLHSLFTIFLMCIKLYVLLSGESIV